MRTTQIRQQLHDYIDAVEEKKLKAIYILLEDDISLNSLLTEDQKTELDKRMADHENGTGRTYTWEETLAMARNAVK